jgi:hypothetical protein
MPARIYKTLLRNPKTQKHREHRSRKGRRYSPDRILILAREQRQEKENRKYWKKFKKLVQ